MMLAMHQDIQENAYNEIVSECTTDASYFDLDAISKLKYLDCILNETMRLYPVISVIGRTAATDIKLKYHTIPKDSMILVYTNKIHYDPLIWGPDVNQFNPNRFRDEYCADRHPYAHLPFSSGPRYELNRFFLFEMNWILSYFDADSIFRNCVGYRYAMISMKIQMCYLLTHFKFTTNVKMSDIRVKYEVMNKFVGGYMLRLQHRHSKRRHKEQE